MKNVLKHTGWVVLSTLCFLGIMLLVQWLTFEVIGLLLIENHLLLLALSLVMAYVFPKWYGLLGAIVFSVTVLLLMFSADNLSFELYNFCSLLVLGAATGSLVKQKRWAYGAGSLVLSAVVLWNAHQNYRTMEVEKVCASKQSDLAKFNTICSTYQSIDGSRLQLSQDTVYLINFTFYACNPCRTKKTSLEEVARTFRNQPFKLITVHNVESMTFFRKYYRNSPDCYHNPNEKSNQKLGISSYPYEIIFDKKGKEVRRMNGFSRDVKANYVEQTTRLLTQLIHDK